MKGDIKNGNVKAAQKSMNRIILWSTTGKNMIGKWNERLNEKKTECKTLLQKTENKEILYNVYRENSCEEYSRSKEF